MKAFNFMFVECMNEYEMNACATHHKLAVCDNINAAT